MRAAFITFLPGILAVASIVFSIGYPQTTNLHAEVRPAVVEKNLVPAVHPAGNLQALAAMNNFGAARTPYQQIHALHELNLVHGQVRNNHLRTNIEVLAAPALEEMTLSRSRDIRMAAIEMTPTLHSAGAPALLAGLLETEKDPEIVLLAGQMLGKVAHQEDLVRLLPVFESTNRMDLRIAIATAWLHTVERTGVRVDEEIVISRILPMLDEGMECESTTLVQHRLVHQVEMKLRNAYGLDEIALVPPPYGIAQ